MRWFLINFDFFSQISFLFFFLIIFLYVFFANLVRMVIYTCCMFVFMFCCFVPSVFIWECLKTEVSQKSYFCTKKCFRQHIDTIIETSAFYFDYIFLHHWWIMMHQTIYIITSEYNWFRCPICGKTFVNVWPHYFLMPL